MGDTIGDQCRFGLQAKGEDGGYRPARKPTRFMSTAPEVLRALGLRCRGDHKHVHLLQGRAAAAAVYPRRLCRAILRGIEAQRRREGQTPIGVHRAQAAGLGVYELGGDKTDTEVYPEPAQTHVLDEADTALDYHMNEYWDEKTGEALPRQLVETAKGEEF